MTEARRLVAFSLETEHRAKEKAAAMYTEDVRRRGATVQGLYWTPRALDHITTSEVRRMRSGKTVDGSERLVGFRDLVSNVRALVASALLEESERWNASELGTDVDAVLFMRSRTEIGARFVSSAGQPKT